MDQIRQHAIAREFFNRMLFVHTKLTHAQTGLRGALQRLHACRATGADQCAVPAE
ncbi:hypothetical protein [Bradyrhizobium centrolobii]|uniref:hypothetical protein n=1 Tax=Bradyrhizobium centrolobii TaxID=1505087 RepID=UPI000A56B696|nr:hypothetical protein [Bradyrhizobium centrolobii]